MNMKGNTILVTGGTSGIGLELARELKKLGNVVIVTGRNAAIKAELEQETLRQVGILGDREIHVPEAGAVDGVAANAEARAHRGAGFQARIRGSGHQHASALARRKAWFVEQ